MGTSCNATRNYGTGCNAMHGVLGTDCNAILATVGTISYCSEKGRVPEGEATQSERRGLTLRSLFEVAMKPISRSRDIVLIAMTGVN